MKYEVRDQQRSVVLGQDLEATQVESILARHPHDPSLNFAIRAVLPVNISAYVIREPGKKEQIEIKSEGVEVVVERQTDLQPTGTISVSCDPDGKKAPVESFNLEFREYNDDVTDRGLVWVIPGFPASFHLIVTGLASKHDVANILSAAEQAVQNQLLSLLQTPESVTQ